MPKRITDNAYGLLQLNPKNIKTGHVANKDLSIQQIKESLSQIRGHLVEMPLQFLIGGSRCFACSHVFPEMDLLLSIKSGAGQGEQAAFVILEG